MKKGLFLASTILWINALIISGAGMAFVLDKFGLHQNLLFGILWTGISIWAIQYYESKYIAPPKTSLLGFPPITQKILLNGHAEQFKSDLKSWADIIEKPICEFTETDWEEFKHYREIQRNSSLE